MANITRIKNNQITDATITFAKIASGTLTGALFNPALTLNSNVTILGNLSVTGNTSTINSTNTYVNDPLIVFNNGYTGSPTYDIGMIANRNLQNLAGYGSVNTAFVWKEADASFQAITTTETGTTTGSITNSGWANVKVGNLTALTTTTGGLQAIAIGNVTPGTAAFTTGTFSSTLDVTGATTLTTATTGGLQAVAIGNVTPGTGVFTTGAFNTATTGGLQAVAIGNVTPGTGVFTTGAFNTATAGGLQAVAIGNVTPGTSVFTTTSTGGLQAQAIGNVTPGTGVFTTTSTGGLQAQAIGNVTPGTGVFTTGAFNTATAGGLQAVAIGNVTPGTGVFVSVQSQAIGNVTPGTGAFTTATAGGLQAVEIGNVTPGTAAFTTTTTNTGTIGGLQAVEIGNVTPGTAAFTTTTTNTGTIGGLQAVAIGNVTPGTGVFVSVQAVAIGNVTPGTAAFTTGTFSSTLGVTGATTMTTATAGGLQAQAIGNVTPGTGVFTTGVFNTATAGGLQAVAIGNATPGTGAFTTATAGSFQGIVGNAAATTAFFTTANATNVYAATIGNASTSLNGSTATVTNWANITGTTAATSTTTGALIVAGGVGVAGNIYSGYTLTAANIVTSGSNGNISGVSNLFTANVIATNVNAVTIGNTGAAITGNTGTLTSLQAVAIGNVTPGTGVFTTGTFNTATTGGLQAVEIGNVTPGTAAFTTATAGSFQGIIGNAAATTAFFTTANATTVNAATIGNIGAVLKGDGGLISNISLGAIGGIFPTANVAMYENIATTTTNAVYYAYLADKASGNVAAVVATGVNVNPSTSTVSALAFVGGTGAFTTLSASGTTTVTDATQSTSSGTGALVVTGGAGIGANLYVGGNTTIIGNLTVVGTTTAVQSTTLDVSDLNITVAKGASTAAAANGAGLTVDGAGATLTYLNATDTWNFNKGLVGTTITTGGLQAVQIGNVTPGTAAFTTATAGSLQGIIGNVAATTAFFTTANATNVYAATVGNASTTLNGNLIGGNANLTSTTAATSTTTGALQVAGGAGVAGNVYVGGSLVTTGASGNISGVNTVYTTTVNATNVYAATIGNIGASVVGNGGFLSNIIGANVTGTVATANVAMYENVATSTTNAVYYPQLADKASGNVAAVVATGVNVNPSTSTISALGFVGGTGSFTTGAFSSTLGVTGATTMTTATTGGLQAVAIGNVTPGSGVFVSVQAVAIGNATPGTGAFTTASTTGNLTVGGNIAVTGNIVPSANVTYSLGTSGNRFKDIYLSGQTQYIGGSVIGEDSDGNLTLTTATGNRLTISSVSNVIVATGNVTAPYHLGNAYGTTGTFLGTGASTSKTTGAVVVAGGVGIAGAVNIGTSLTVDNGSYGNVVATEFGSVYATANNPNNYALLQAWSPHTGGGLGLNAFGNIVYSAGAINFTTGVTVRDKDYPTGGTTGVQIAANGAIINTTGIASNSTGTGAVIVTGGAGISGNINVGSNAIIGGYANVTGAVTIGSTATIAGNTAVNNTLYGRGVYDNGVQVVSTSTGAGNLTISTGGINLTPVGPGVVTTGDATSIPVITTDAYGRITSISTASVVSVAGAANVAFHTQTVALSNNATFYPTFSNINGGNSIPGTSSSLSYNPGTGTLTASAAAINGGTASSSYTSGALIVTGGVGVSGNIYTNSGITAAGKVITTNNEDATSTSTGAIQATGGISTQANLYVGKAAVFNSSQTAGMDVVARGATDATLIWARPSASYDTVIIGNSATASTVVAGAKLNINTTDSIKLPVGTNAQRPGNQGQTDVQGMFRYSTTQNAVEWYTGTQWIAATTTFTVITDEQFNGDGSTVAFTLAGATTTASTIVSINGVMQIPTLAYAVSGGTTLTFTEAPASGDIIDVRRLTTTETVIALNDATGYNAVDVDNVDGVTLSTGTAAKNARFRINTDGAQVSLLANTAIASANVATTIDTMATGTYRSAKYTVQATNGANYQVLEALLISNGTTATVMAYGTIQTAGNLGIISATQSGSNALLQFVALNASTNVRITKEYLLI